MFLNLLNGKLTINRYRSAAALQTDFDDLIHAVYHARHAENLTCSLDSEQEEAAKKLVRIMRGNQS